jgi:sulfur carrier protein ThiS
VVAEVVVAKERLDLQLVVVAVAAEQVVWQDLKDLVLLQHSLVNHKLYRQEALLRIEDFLAAMDMDLEPVAVVEEQEPLADLHQLEELLPEVQVVQVILGH